MGKISKLAARYRNISIFLLTLILIITITVSGIMIYNFVQTASMDYVRFYTVESVDILQTHLNKEISLVQHMAQSAELIEWFANEENAEKKDAAFTEMMLYVDMLQTGSLHFAILSSLNEYSIESDAPFEAFKPTNVLSTANSYDRWFFNTINSFFDFTLNLDMCKTTNTRRLWINYKVVKDGTTVGVFCSALQFDEIFNDLFGHYDSGNVKGFVIDHRGVIQIDSTDPEPTLLSDGGSSIGTETHILTISNNDEFISAINRHQRNPEIFHGRTEPEVIRLSEGDYRFLSIAPIPNTNWLIVNLFNSSALFNVMRILPPIIVVVLAFAIYTALNTVIVRRMLFKPLEMLASSVSKTDKNISAIYGTDRDDEIGKLARETEDAWKRINENAEEIKKAADKADAANRSKSEFLANMSHEIRTPMNSIIGFSELALDDNIPYKTKDYLSKILDNSEWLLQILNDVLDISKIESGKMELESIPFDLGEIFAACRIIILPKALEKGLKLYFYAEPSVGKRLYGDPMRLRQVIVNLLSNAIKFTNSGMVKVHSKIGKVENDTVTILFEVKDSGIGITAAQLERIFDPFSQAESGTTRKYGGSGLGLAITKNIVETMGGRLYVESTPGVGSKFSFELPFKAISIDDDNYVSERKIFKEMKKPVFNGEVLVCEDNSMNQQVISEHLARVGLKSVLASNGKVCVDMVKSRMDNPEGEKQFDLILMDIHMPVMDGLEAAAKIGKLGVKIPIVAMTANIMSNDREIYSELGMNDIVSKPFTTQELWKCLMKYLEPVDLLHEDENQRDKANEELRQKLINNFVANNKEKYTEIQKAIDSDDVILAHRLVHTLKSNAGQLNKTLLQNAAEVVEESLKDGKDYCTQREMKTLELELNAALEELTPLVNEAADDELSEPVSYEEACLLLDELKPLLEDSDPESLNCINGIKRIPGSADLIRSIEDFEYITAIEKLNELKEGLEK